MRRWLVDRGGWLALATLAYYAWLAPAHVVDGDNAEFATLGALGGVAHPSGYPLYVLWLRAAHGLAAPVHAAALATALLGAVAILVLHAACRAWGARPTSATIACALVATAPGVVRMSTQAEVFALNDLVAACVLWLAAAGGPLRGVPRAAALGLVAGLGLANHQTCVLVAPVGLYGIALAVREARLAALPVALIGLAVGLSPYAYLFVAPASPASWGAVSTFDDLLAMVTRRAYGGPGAFAATGEPRPGENEVALLASLARAYALAPLVGALAVLAARVRARATRWPWAMLALSVLLAGPWLVSRFNLETVGCSGYVVRRFHLLPIFLLAVPAAAGLDAAGAWLARRVDRLAGYGPHLAALVFVVAGAATLPSVARGHSPAVARGIENLLRSMPPDAVLLTTNDDLLSGTHYAQLVEDLRRDVVVMQPAWYRDYAASIGARVDPADRRPEDVQFASLLLARGRAVFVDPMQGALRAAMPSYPWGAAWRLLPLGAPLPPLDEIRATNQRLVESFAFGYELPSMDDDYATLAQLRYVEPWRWLAARLAAAGREDDAAQAAGVAEALAPRP